MRFLLSIVLLGLAVTTVHGFIGCADPSKHVGHWIGKDQECAALVQTSCHRQPGNKPIGLTNHWIRYVDLVLRTKWVKIDF